MRYVIEEREMTHVRLWEIKDTYDQRNIVATVYDLLRADRICQFLNQHDNKR